MALVRLGRLQDTVSTWLGGIRRRALAIGLVICLAASLPEGGTMAVAVSQQPAAPASVTTREHHTTTVLGDGRVLVVGGRVTGGPLASTFLFDPATMSWSVSDSMAVARYGHTATPLPDGRVLVAGGSNCHRNCTPENSLSSAELYDPNTGTWAHAPSMAATRTRFAAALLPDGRVLVAGGYGVDAESMFTGATTLRSAEIYDPHTNAWQPAASLHIPRQETAIVHLFDGRIAVMSGRNDLYQNLPITRETLDQRGELIQEVAMTGELYDPTSDTWLLTLRNPDRYVELRMWWMALPDGRIAGIADQQLEQVVAYEPMTDSWRRLSLVGDTKPTSDNGATSVVRLADGRVLAVGGDSGPTGSSGEDAFIFDAATPAWTPTGRMTSAREGHTAVTLADGRVLVFGGRQYVRGPQTGSWGVSRRVRTSELYDPATGQWTALDQSPPDLTPQTARGGPCPISARACDFAAQLSRWLADGNVAAVADQTTAHEVTCGTESENQDRALTMFCVGAQPGEIRNGGHRFGSIFVIGHVDRGQYEALLRQLAAAGDASLLDAYGSGQFRLIGFECSDESGMPACADGYVILFSWIERSQRTGEPGRASIGFFVRLGAEDESPRIDTAVIGPIVPGFVDGYIPWLPPDAPP